MNDTPAPTVWPALQARDAHALIEFLVDVVGFEKTAVYEDGDMVAHAQLDWPEGGGIMMGSHKPGGEWSREPGTFGAYVVTDRVDELYERVKGKGATITRDLADQDYGNREFAIADPEGNLWSFGPYRGEKRG
ncbi:MAG: VOC family protein [Actinomycetia bacterium]|nr:VOC family protein [Actinomycetes bacterium]